MADQIQSRPSGGSGPGARRRRRLLSLAVAAQTSSKVINFPPPARRPLLLLRRRPCRRPIFSAARAERTRRQQIGRKRQTEADRVPHRPPALLVCYATGPNLGWPASGGPNSSGAAGHSATVTSVCRRHCHYRRRRGRGRPCPCRPDALIRASAEKLHNQIIIINVAAGPLVGDHQINRNDPAPGPTRRPSGARSARCLIDRYIFVPGAPAQPIDSRPLDDFWPPPSALAHGRCWSA